MAGYTVKQLLEWTREDRLIDGYSMLSGDRIVIHRGGTEYDLSEADAEVMLRDLIRRINGGDAAT